MIELYSRVRAYTVSEFIIRPFRSDLPVARRRVIPEQTDGGSEAPAFHSGGSQASPQSLTDINTASGKTQIRLDDIIRPRKLSRSHYHVIATAG
jgi:hypothetical protein